MRCDISTAGCDAKTGTSHDIAPLTGHRAQTNGTSTPLSADAGELLSSTTLPRIHGTFQRRRQEFFRHMDISNPSSNENGNAVYEQRPSSVIPFGNHNDSVVAVAALTASFSAGDVSARPHPADNSTHYASSVFNNPHVNISLLRASTNNVGAYSTLNDSASSMAARVGSAIEHDTPESGACINTESVPSSPLVNKSQAANAEGDSGYHTQYVGNTDSSSIKYSSTTEYVRAGRVAPAIYSTTLHTVLHVPQPANSNFSGSRADLNGGSGMPTGEVHKTITYSPSTSFSMTGNSGGVAFTKASIDDNLTSVGAVGNTEDDLGETGPYCTGDGQPIDLEDMLLLQQPILRPNSHFFCCFYKFHITAVAKVLSIIYAFVYALMCVFSYKSQHAAAFLIAVLVYFSVGASTLYSTFKWSKLCLIPFFLLQTMLVFYALICVPLLIYALAVGPPSYTFGEFQRHLDGTFNLNTNSWLAIILAGLMLLTLFLFYSALLFWYEYQFIAEVDRFLKSIRRSSSQASRDDAQTQNGANFNSKSAF